MWAAAGGLSALTIVLKAPFQGLTPDVIVGPGLLLAALAAAVIARMESLPVAFGAGVGLGILEQLVLWNSSRPSTTDVAFLAVILLALLLRRDTLTRAAAAGESGWLSAGVVRHVPRELRGLHRGPGGAGWLWPFCSPSSPSLRHCSTARASSIS